ncbi:MAG: dockerin type I domain-containing protein [Pirellulales bacterium]
MNSRLVKLLRALFPIDLPTRFPRVPRGLRLEKLENRLAMATFTVTNTLDSGEGSFRQAILDSNANVGEDFIAFDIQGGSRKIQPLTPLPFVRDSVSIQAGTQPGFDGLPVVELDGSLTTGEFVSGLVLNADIIAVRGFHIHNFDYGITILNGRGNSITGNAIGADPRGNAHTINRSVGVYLIDATDNVVGADYRTFGNLISGNLETGVRISGNSSGNKINGNLIGTTVDGNSSYGSQQFGVLISQPAFGNIVGTNGDTNGDDAERNLISGNSIDGVRIFGSDSNTVAGNLIGTTLNGMGQVEGQANGIVLDRGANRNTIGTNADGFSDFAEGNFIVGHSGMGVRLYQSNENFVAGNFVGLGVDGKTPMSNQNSGIVIDGGSSKNVVGMSQGSQLERNYIAANQGWGVSIFSGSANRVSGNYIGLNASGDSSFNGVGAVQIVDSSNNWIGGTSETFGNSIGYAVRPGLMVLGASVGNLLSANTYLGDLFLPIDLNGDERSFNDPLDVDKGPNDILNFPIIERAGSDSLGTVVTGRVESVPYARMTVELLHGADPEEANRLELTPFGSVEVVTDSAGIGNWVFESDQTFPIGVLIRAIAHNQKSGSSEVSSVPSGFISTLRRITLSQSSIDEIGGSVEVTVHRYAGDPQGSVQVALSANEANRLQLPPQVTIPADQQSITFFAQAIDNSSYFYNDLLIIADRAVVALHIAEDESPWHNYALPLDVSGNGTITPVDALQVIDYLNSVVDRSLIGKDPLKLPSFIDVNLDQIASPSDVLKIINFLSSRSAGEGEIGSNENSRGEDLAAVDYLFTDIGSIGPLETGIKRVRRQS